MFNTAYQDLRGSVYGIVADFGNGSATGTAFMIAPGICATAAHNLHEGRNVLKSVTKTTKIYVIRALDFLNAPIKMSAARLLAEDIEADLALIEIMEPTDPTSIKLFHNELEMGTRFGTLGFPFSRYTRAYGNQLPGFDFIERFQGSVISCSRQVKSLAGGNATVGLYQTRMICDVGSSGAPGFTDDASVVGMIMASIAYSNKVGQNVYSYLLPSTYIISLAQKNNVKLTIA